jgi:PAS domain S-box-containing protein
MTHYFQAGLHFTLFLLNSGLVLWIFRARKRIPLQSICMALCACFAVWSLSEVVIALAARRETAQLFCKIGSVGWIFTPTIFLIFSLAYTDNLRKYRSMWFHSIVYGPYLVFLVSSWMGNLCNVVRFGNLWESSFQPLTYLFCLYCAITACYSFLALYRFFRSATVPIKKRRTMVIIATSFLTYVPIQVTEIYFQLLSIHLPIRFGAFFTIVWIGGVAWAILRFKFLEITTAVVADAIIDAMSEALFLVDNDGKIMSCNRAAEILTEYNKAELRGRPVMAFFNDGAVLLPIPRSDAGTGITARECTVMSQCGGSTSVLVSLSPVIDEEAAVAGYVLTARDISVWKKFEEKLRKNHEQWMLAINGSQDGIWDWDIHNDKMFLSPNWKRMIGYEDNELPNEVATFKDRIHPEDRERVQAIIDRFIQGIVKQYSVEFRFRHKNGTFRWILARAEALRDGSGIAYRMAGSHSDITDRKEIQEQLLRRNMAIENERMNLEIIFDSAQVGLMLINNERVVTRANNALASIVGSEASRLLDKRPGEGLCCAVIATTGDQCGSTPQCRSCPIRLLLSTVLDDKVPVIGVEFCKEFSIHGTTVSLWLDLNGCPVVINDVPHALVSIVDVTVRKNMEISLAKARDDAEAAARAKGEFLANMSHEIRTPMNSILGMLELVCDNDLSAEQRSYAEIARSSGESLLSIINDILDFSRIEAQELKLDSIAFDVRAMLEDTACLLAVKAHEKGIELNCMVAPDVPTWIVGDPGRLRQVLINLGGNAVKFTGRGAVTIRADIDKEDDTSVTMRFAIIDTGIGIPAGMTGRLFKPFSQVDGSITRRFGGTGLGLAISRELVQLMGGTIEVESEEGKGSTFRFVVTFEKARPFKQTASDAPRRCAGGNESPYHRRARRIPYVPCGAACIVGPAGRGGR